MSRVAFIGFIKNITNSFLFTHTYFIKHFINIISTKHQYIFYTLTKFFFFFFQKASKDQKAPIQFSRGLW